ncbi:MAG: D-glycero-beta-D-manno-heptose-7-phosphate kinase [candidate division Zixibacteria bacterium]|nr:D-glycero-beta-D-manno-heptose-7-phosphate kinase [candidate division Zixibacteria bacterium]
MLKTKDKNTANQVPIKISKPRLDRLFSGFDKCRIMVVGDIMLDRYLWGAVSRISPEAPVPVVEISKEECLLGGAANVANNIAALGGQPLLLGITGKDSFASVLKKELTVRNFSINGVFTDSSRPTTVKTRIIASNQQVVRADREKTHEISKRLNKKLADYIDKTIDNIKAVIVSDYGKGVINSTLLDYLISACNKRDIFIAVDPKESQFFNYKHVSAITPNHHEAGFVVGKKIKDDATLVDVGWQILDRLEAKSLLITLGEKGMALFENGVSEKNKRLLTKIPTLARRVYDVTGAGDTVIAALTMASAAGASLKEAAFIANIAAGEVVAEVGTAQVKKDRLKKLAAKYI